VKSVAAGIFLVLFCITRAIAQNNGCAAEVVTRCVDGAILVNQPTTAPIVCLGSEVSVTTTLDVKSNASIVTTINTDCSQSSVTNFYAPTSVSVGWTVTMTGGYSNSGSGLTATFTPTNCGSANIVWTNSYYDGCDTNLQLGGAALGSFTVLSLTIWDDNTALPISSENTNNVAIVGQEMLLAANQCGGAFSNFQWSVAGTAETDFYVSDGPYPTNGGPVDLTDTTNDETIYFFWADEGSKEVTCAAECAGVTCSTSATFTVLRPTASITTATVGCLY
jgi:hypothetical protein